eukprot:maker-scaffold_9-snap-gene-0.4-mRNA-1 protein AED:0.06 eAED:0.06 QI:0/0.33/0.25/0.75/0.66/0.5/4/1012/125
MKRNCAVEQLEDIVRLQGKKINSLRAQISFKTADKEKNKILQEEIQVLKEKVKQFEKYIRTRETAWKEEKQKLKDKFCTEIAILTNKLYEQKEISKTISLLQKKPKREEISEEFDPIQLEYLSNI